MKNDADSGWVTLAIIKVGLVSFLLSICRPPSLSRWSFRLPLLSSWWRVGTWGIVSITFINRRIVSITVYSITSFVCNRRVVVTLPNELNMGCWVLDQIRGHHFLRLTKWWRYRSSRLVNIHYPATSKVIDDSLDISLGC